MKLEYQIKPEDVGKDLISVVVGVFLKEILEEMSLKSLSSNPVIVKVSDEGFKIIPNKDFYLVEDEVIVPSVWDPEMIDHFDNFPLKTVTTPINKEISIMFPPCNFEEISEGIAIVKKKHDKLKARKGSGLIRFHRKCFMQLKTFTNFRFER